MALSHADKLKHCVGCRDDFYNHDGRGMGGGKCWMLPKAKLVTRFKTHRDAMPAHYGSFEQVKVFQCKNGGGWYYPSTLPAFVKLEEVIGSPAWRRKTAVAEGRVRGRQKT